MNEIKATDPKILFEFLDSINKLERERFYQSDEKAGKFLILHSILLGFMLFIANHIIQKANFSSCLYILFLVLIAIAFIVILVFIGIGLITLTNSFRLFQFVDFTVNDEVKEFFQNTNTDSFYMKYSEQLIEIAKENKKQNEIKMKYIRKGNIFCKWSYIILFTVLIPLFLGYSILIVAWR